LFELAAYFASAQARQSQIEHNGRWRRGLKAFYRSISVGSNLYRVSFGFKQTPQRLLNRVIVFHNKNSLCWRNAYTLLKFLWAILEGRWR
jgi:hypothetical protein